MGFSYSAMLCCEPLRILVCNMQNIITDIKINLGILGVTWKSRTFPKSNVMQILICDIIFRIFWNSIKNMVSPLRSYLEYPFSTLNLTDFHGDFLTQRPKLQYNVGEKTTMSIIYHSWSFVSTNAMRDVLQTW